MKRLSIFLATCGIALGMSAQRYVVSTQVKGTDNRPVVGAMVSVPEHNIHVVTDDKGFFKFETDAKLANLQIKADGYYAQELPLDYLAKQSKDQSFYIMLVPENEFFYAGNLVTPYGEVAANEKSASAATLENKDFTDELSVSAAAHNGFAGLRVIEKSGLPGEGAYMNIRGVHSMVAENNPLIVINGIPYLTNQGVSGVINGYSRDVLFAYSPRDIKSISVLKGADAAMYGSLASNGVILIETAQPTSDNLDTRISYSGQYGLNLSQRSFPVMNSAQYRRYLQDIGMTRYSNMTNLMIDYPFLQNEKNYYSYLFNENTNWSDEIQHTAFSTENVFRVEGGDEIAKYNISFGYTKDDGTIRNTGNDRFHTLIGSNVLVSRNVDIFTNVSLAYVTSDLQNQGMALETNPMLAAYNAMPLISPYKKQDDGSLLDQYATYNGWNVSSNPNFAYDNVSNPLAIVNTLEAKDKIYDVNMRIGLNYRANSYLKFTGLYSLYYNYTEETLFVPGVTNQAITPQVYGTGRNKVSMGVSRQLNNYFSLSGDYNRTFNSVHKVSALASARMMMKNIEYDYASGYNTANDFYKTLDKTQDEKVIDGDNIAWNYLSYLLRADYTYNHLVRTSAGVSIDGTSVSGVDAPRFGVFPFAGVTFMAANTGVLPNCFNMLNLSLEASMTGNSRFSSNYAKNYYLNKNFLNLGTINRSNVPNGRLEWEKTKQIDLGLELSMFEGKLGAGVNLFANNSYDLLLNSDISEVYGSTVYYDNRGEISGKGLEASVRINPVHTKNFDWVISANTAIVRNRVESLGDKQTEHVFTYTDYNNDDAQVRMQVGASPYQYYGYQTAGIYATSEEAAQAGLTNKYGTKYQAGDVIFIDQNDDKIIDDKDKVNLGSAQPDFFGGFNTMLRFKKVSLQADFAYSIGNRAYNATRRELESMDNFYNQSTAVLNRWQVEGQEAKLPRAAYGDPSGNNLFSDRWIEDADYLKLRSLKVAYHFDHLFSLVRSGTVYLAGENLFTLTDYLGSDPEFAYSYDESLRGFDYAKFAMPVTVKIGFNLNF